VATFTQESIDELISCLKEVTEGPKRLQLDRGQWRADAVLVASNDIKGTFRVFLRKNEDFPENFSVGLNYTAHDERGEITLIRCNGKHGDFNKGFDPDHPHFAFHIHRATEKALNDGFAAERYAEKTDAFASYEEAVQYFVDAVNLNREDQQKYFGSPDQTLFGFVQ
jgi:hypothetical protein